MKVWKTRKLKELEHQRDWLSACVQMLTEMWTLKATLILLQMEIRISIRNWTESHCCSTTAKNLAVAWVLLPASRKFYSEIQKQEGGDQEHWENSQPGQRRSE